MEMELNRGFSFPVGYRRFHKDQLFNFQLNRPFSLGYMDAEGFAEAGENIRSFPEWKTEMLRQAEVALSEGRLMNSAFFFRAAEFYTFADDPDKELFYERFFTLFHEAFAAHQIQRIEIPYQNAFLPALRLLPEGIVRGTIVLHGGYDSFIEEFYSLMWYFTERGFGVIGFDGPGQGGARRKAGLPLDFRWEKPVGAVLDHLELEDVTIGKRVLTRDVEVLLGTLAREPLPRRMHPFLNRVQVRLYSLELCPGVSHPFSERMDVEPRRHEEGGEEE